MFTSRPSTILFAESVIRVSACATAEMRYTESSSWQPLGFTTHLDSPRQIPTGDEAVAGFWCAPAETDIMPHNMYAEQTIRPTRRVLVATIFRMRPSPGGAECATCNVIPLNESTMG